MEGSALCTAAYAGITLLEVFAHLCILVYFCAGMLLDAQRFVRNKFGNHRSMLIGTSYEAIVVFFKYPSRITTLLSLIEKKYDGSITALIFGNVAAFGCAFFAFAYMLSIPHIFYCVYPLRTIHLIKLVHHPYGAAFFIDRLRKREFPFVYSYALFWHSINSAAWVFCGHREPNAIPVITFAMYASSYAIGVAEVWYMGVGCVSVSARKVKQFAFWEGCFLFSILFASIGYGRIADSLPAFVSIEMLILFAVVSVAHIFIVVSLRLPQCNLFGCFSARFLVRGNTHKTLLTQTPTRDLPSKEV